ncbi:MAG: NifB/NifX family molybdenum-iron cluster-binding protein [Candidatus Omnitrophota bacterium]|nr:NifB/NifX family molybdenum-iron cluster-binding protein [Candidatus Omnitrophota bacterium]
MKVGISLENENGLYSNVCKHFQESSHFFILDIDKNKIVSSRVVPNHVRHNGKEYIVADEVLKYRITHLIADNVGVAAQKRFVQTNVQVFKYSGNVKDAIDNFFKKNMGLALKKTYEAMPEPKFVIATGDCAKGGAQADNLAIRIIPAEG